jgi:hypothetical protein
MLLIMVVQSHQKVQIQAYENIFLVYFSIGFSDLLPLVNILKVTFIS